MKKKSLSEIITATFTKNTLRIAAFIVGLLLVIILSIGQFALDFNNVNWAKWFSDTLLLVSIQIIFMVLGEGSKDTIRQNPNGLFNKRLGEYRIERNKVDNITPYFSEYHMLHREQALKNKIIMRLQNAGFAQAKEIYENLSDSQIELLTHEPMEVNGIEFTAFQDNGQQAKEFIKIKRETRIGKTTPIYYLTEDAKNDCLTDQDVPEVLEKKKKAVIWGGRTLKIIIGCSLSIIWAAFTVQEFMEGSDLQAWYNLFTRIFSVIQGLINGILVAFGVNSIDCRELNEKTMFLHNFYIEYESKDFVPTSHHERFLKQKEEFEKRQKEVEEFNKQVEIVSPYENKALQIEEKEVINL